MLRWTSDKGSSLADVLFKVLDDKSSDPYGRVIGIVEKGLIATGYGSYKDKGKILKTFCLDCERIYISKEEIGWPQPWKGRSGISLVKERIEEESNGLLTIKTN